MTSPRVRVPDDVAALFDCARDTFIWVEQHGVAWDWPGLQLFRDALGLLVEASVTNDPKREREFLDAARTKLGVISSSGSHDVAVAEHLRAVKRADTPLRRLMAERIDKDPIAEDLRRAAAGIEDGTTALMGGDHISATTYFKSSFERSLSAGQRLEAPTPRLQHLNEAIRVLLVPAAVAITLFLLDRAAHLIASWLAH